MKPNARESEKIQCDREAKQGGARGCEASSSTATGAGISNDDFSSKDAARFNWHTCNKLIDTDNNEERMYDLDQSYQSTGA